MLRCAHEAHALLAARHHALDLKTDQVPVNCTLEGEGLIQEVINPAKQLRVDTSGTVAAEASFRAASGPPNPRDGLRDAKVSSRILMEPSGQSNAQHTQRVSLPNGFSSTSQRHVNSTTSLAATTLQKVARVS